MLKAIIFTTALLLSGSAVADVGLTEPTTHPVNIYAGPPRAKHAPADSNGEQPPAAAQEDEAATNNQ